MFSRRQWLPGMHMAAYRQASPEHWSAIVYCRKPRFALEVPHEPKPETSLWVAMSATTSVSCWVQSGVLCAYDSSRGPRSHLFS